MQAALDQLSNSEQTAKPLDGRLRELYLRKVAAHKELQRRIERRFMDTLFPEKGELSRHNYKKHMEFFEAGESYTERCFMAANRIGKTVAGGYEMACHLTGVYPSWWKGAVFDEPTDCWAAGKTNETTRDIIQLTLFGRVVGSGQAKSLSGTGLIYGDSIIETGITWRSGVSNLVDTVPIAHLNGGNSIIGLKSYEQGRGSFEGTAKHAIWHDEEPPIDVYSECLIRIVTTDGVIYITFTPLEGMSQTVLQFLPNGIQQLKRDMGVQ